MTLSGQLQAADVQLELLTGPLSSIYGPGDMGAMFFAVLTAAQIERNYIREKTLEGQVTAAAKGNHGGRPKVIDDDMLTFARALKDKGVPVPAIAKQLTIKTGKNAGQHPSVASVYRALAEAEETGAPAGPEIIAPRRPTGWTSPGPEAAPPTRWARSLNRPRTRRSGRAARACPTPRGARVIPLPPHRTKGPGALGAERPGQIGPFGRWPDPREDEGHDESDAEDPAPKVTQGSLVTWFAARQQRPLFARPDA